MTHHSRLNILVVDDDPDFNAFMEEFLTNEGYDVKAITDPKLAIPEAKTGEYQLVFLDLMMPGLKGSDVLDQIRRFDEDIVVVIMTGYPSVESSVQAMQAKAFDYLTKPFEVEKVRQVITRAIHERGLIAEPDTRLSEAIGQKVKHWREEQKLTLKQLASRTGFSVSLLSQIERGETSPSIHTLYRIAHALKKKMSEFVEGF